MERRAGSGEWAVGVRSGERRAGSEERRADSMNYGLCKMVFILRLDVANASDAVS